MNAPHTILLVDSSAIDRSIYQHWLIQDTECAYTVLEADSGQSALDLCQQSWPDGIVLADRLSDMSGLEVLEQLKQQTQQPVVVLGEADVAAAVQTMKHGAVDYLVRSQLTAATLCCALQAAIGHTPAAAAPAPHVSPLPLPQRLQVALKREDYCASAILDAVGALVVVLDGQGRIVCFNRVCEQVTGYAFAEMEGQPVWQLLLPEEAEAVKTVFNALCVEQVPSQYENHWLTRTGDRRLIVWSNTVSVNVAGTVEYIVMTGVDVTERNQMETALCLSEERHRLAVDLTYIGTWDWQIATGQIAWSDSHFRLLGLVPSGTEVCYQTWRNCVHSEDIQRIEQLITDALASRTNYEAEYRVVHPDGSIHWVVARGQGLYDDTDRPIRMVGIVMDISERKRSEDEHRQIAESLRHSEATNRAIIQAIPDLLIRMTRDGDCLDIISRRMGKGAYPACAIQDGATFAALFPNLKEQKLNYTRNALESGELQIYEQEICIDNTTYHEELRIVPTDADEVLIIIRDITARKQVEAIHKETEEQFRHIADSAPVLIWMSGLDQLCYYFNKSWLQFTGRTQEQEQGNGWLENVHPDDFKTCLGIYTTAFDARQTFQMEYRLKRFDGEYRWIIDTGMPRLDKEGNFLGYIGSCVDIHDRKQAVLALQDSEARFHAFMNNSPTASWITDADGRIYYVSQTYFQMFQLPTEDLIGKTVSELYPDAIAQQFLNTTRRVAETGQVTEVIESAPKRDGTAGEFLMYKFPLPEMSGQRLVGGVAIDITERLQVEQALRQLNQDLEQRVEQRTAALQASEAVLQAVFNQAAVGISLTRANGSYLNVNQAYCDILGYSLEQLLLTDFNQLTHPDDVDKGEQERQLLFAGKIPSFSVEKRYIRSDGSCVWVNITASAVSKVSGEVDYAIGVVEDIHQRKQAEAQLRRSEARYRAIVEDQTELIARYAPDTTLLFVNEAYCRYLGVNREEILGTSYAPQIVEADQEQVAQLVQSMSFDNPTVTIENRLMRNGEVRWTQWINRMLFDDQGTFIEYQAVGRDITARKLAEEKLQQQLEREILVATITHRIRESLDLSTILNTTVAEIQQLLQADRVLVYRLSDDSSGQTIAESRKPLWSSLLGLQFASEAFPPDVYQRYVQGCVYVLSNRQQESVIPCMKQFMQTFTIQAKLVAPIIHQDALWGLLIVHHCSAPRQWQGWEVRLLQHLANQLAIATKQSELYQQIQFELNEREHMQHLLEQTNNQLLVKNLELARATRHKDEFLASMSHELRTPLNAILGMSEALLEEICGPLTVRQHKAIATIEKSGTHLLVLINDILDLAKIEAGKLELHITPVSVAALCDSSLNFVKSMADQKKIQLTAHIQPHCTPMTVEADDRRLQQVLINLLSNAVKFTPAGGSVTLEVWCEEVAQSRDPETALSTLLPPVSCFYLAVSDTGIGIAQEDLDLIFQPFRQIDSSLSRQYTGTGLGLALVQRIVTMHQGSITVESEVGVGSRFTVRLPTIIQVEQDEKGIV